MKLIIVTTVPQTLWAFFRGQIGYMKSKDFEIFAVSSEGKELSEVAEREGIATHVIPMVRGVSLFADLAALIRMWRLLRAVKPSIVHAHTPKAGMLSMLAGLLAGVPLRVYTVHGLVFTTKPGITAWAVKWMERLTCACAHRVICVSESVRETITTLNLCPVDKSKVLLKGSINGIDTRRFDPDSIPLSEKNSIREQYGIPHDAQVLGFMGRIVRDKGVYELIEAWAGLKELFPKLHLLMVGPMETHDPVTPRLIEGIEGDPRIHHTGFITETVKAYSIMDVLALPTYREGFPYAPLEAAAMKLPVVASRVTGCVDAVVDGVTGILVPPKDPEALKEAISRLLEDVELKNSMGQAARERCIKDYRPEDIWKALYEEYISLLKTKGLPIPSLNGEENRGQ